MKKLFIIIGILFLLAFSGCVSGNMNPQNNAGTGIITEDYLLSTSFGEIEGAYTVYKFGANDNVGTSLVPITSSGNYQTPTTAQSLEVLSDNINDNSAGSGARKITIIGLNSSGDEFSISVNLSGTTPVAISKSFLRVYTMFVEESGSYASQTTPSQLGTITLRGNGGGSIWAQIENIGGFGVSQTEIAAYTVPKGFNCYLLSKTFSVNSIKNANVFFFKRENITNIVAPYNSMRLIEKQIGVSGVQQVLSSSSIIMFPELTDIGFMAKTDVGSAEVSAEFELFCKRS